MRKILIVAISGMMFMSCDMNSSKSDIEVIDSSVIPPKTTQEPAVPQPAPLQPVTGTASQLPVNAQPSTVPVTLSGSPINQVVPATNITTVPATQQTVQATAPGMNPPHGQPNHRCDISVGAPLNSKPPTGKMQAVPMNATAPVTTTANAAPVVVTPAGMNPPHGQPNHRCDIAVGAPLNSKPAQAKPATPIVIPAASIVPQTEKKDTANQ